MDVRLPGLSGIEITRQIARRFPQVHVVLLSYTADETYLEQALQVGAKGFLLVSDESRQIRDALRAVLRGDIAVTPVLSDVWARLRARSAAGAPLEPITSREHEVLTLIAAGYSSQMIADQMGISRRTVEVHRRNLKAKLQTKNSAQLIQAAIRLGLVSFKP
jgi:DNA-binding NarL/FixJ family response regulator